jgi:Flp pilus assembly protein TadD
MGDASDAAALKARAAMLSGQGRLVEALGDLHRARALAPGDPAVLVEIGRCLARLERPAEAIAAIDAALELDPAQPHVHYLKGWLLEQLGELDRATTAHEEAVRLQPRYGEPLASLASIAARRGESSKARMRAGQALALDEGQPTAAAALAMAELADGRFQAAEEVLRRLVGSTRLGPHARGVALGLLGDALDGQGRAADAFAAYEAENAASLALHAPRFGAPGRGPVAAHVARLLDHFEQERAQDWREPAPDAAGAPHVFLVGFPRSGTTLAGQVLGSHPELTTLDEAPTLAQAGDAFMADADALARLKAAGEEELGPWRETYWRNVAQAGAAAGGGLVDKLPLNLVSLPLVARLFPHAKTLIMRRDPRDVVLSCFRRHFVINPANFEFLTLEGTARFYDAVMRLTERYLEVLPLQVMNVSYEALALDFECQTRAVCDFLGLEWTDDMRRFDQRREIDQIRTPSARQIARGLYGDAVGQWRRYEAQLAPVLPILEPWIARFGCAEG